MKKVKDILLVSLAFLACPRAVGTESGKAVLPEPCSGVAEDVLPDGSRMGIIVRRNPWNSGRNAAGMRQDTLNVSAAELYGRYDSGGFRDIHEGVRSWSAGAAASGLMHLERISFSGTFSFENFSGYGMSGPMSARPGYYPAGVLEFTPGNKTKQIYSFSGAFSADMGRHWRAGAYIDYEAVNYVKRKDLRHTTYAMDMTVTPSLMYHNGMLALGISGIFSKNAESVKAEELGISASTYYAFLDKGLMYGAYESWEGSGVHLSEAGINGFPVRELLYGGAVQGQYGAFYAEAEYLYGCGRAGEKQTLWFVFPGHEVSVRTGFSWPSADASSVAAVNVNGRHTVRLDFRWKTQSDMETVIGERTENGVTSTVVYGYNQVFRRSSLSLCPEYEYVCGRLLVRAGISSAALERMASPMYPYIFLRRDVLAGIHAGCSVPVRSLDISAGIAFRTAWTEEKDLVSEPAPEAGDPPYHLEDWYLRHGEYMTAPRINAGLGLRYNFRNGLYVTAEALYVHAFALVHVGGGDRWTETLKFGYTF